MFPSLVTYSVVIWKISSRQWYDRRTDGQHDSLYLLIEGLPHRVTSGPLSTKSNLTEVEYNTKQAHFTNVKQRNIIRQLVPSVFLIKNGKES